MLRINPTKGKYPVVTYGILKQKFKGESITIGADCHDLGAFPAITKLGTENPLEAKLIYVDQETLNDFDRIEGVPYLYTRELIKVGDITAFIYVYVDKEEIENTPLITNWERKKIKPQLRDMLPKGYKTYTGTVMTDEEIFEYNSVQKSINASLKRGFTPCNELLNLSHHLLRKAAEK